MERFDYLVKQNIRDPGSIKLRTIFPLISGLPKLSQLQCGIKKALSHAPHLPFLFPGYFCFNVLERQLVKHVRHYLHSSICQFALHLPWAFCAQCTSHSELTITNGCPWILVGHCLIANLGKLGKSSFSCCL